ncbi:MAG: thiamine phosphate synthase [Gemmatimonadales bacterium]
MSGRRPLPRVHAITDGAVLALPDLAVRAAALAAAGSGIALHVRDRGAPVGALAAVAGRFVALARPAEASVFVNARADVAAAAGAHGVQLGAADLAPADARRLLPHGWIGRSVHGVEEARAAREEGAEFLLVGPVYETASHPGRPGGGPALVRACAGVGLPVIAVGGITATRVEEMREAGAYGVAAIRGLWLAPDPAGAALEYLAAID